MESIKDLFCACNISILYNSNNITLSLNDIETNKPINIISTDKNKRKKILDALYTNFEQFSIKNKITPCTALLVGYFEEYDSYINWNLDEVGALFTFIDLKLYACKVCYDSKTNCVLFIDILSENIVVIHNTNEYFNTFITDYATDVVKTEDLFTNKISDTTVLIGGNMFEVSDYTYTIEFNENLLFGDIDIMYEELTTQLLMQLRKDS